MDGQEDGEGAGQDRDPEPTPPASGSPVPGPAPAGPDPRLAGFAYDDSGDAPAPSGPMALLTAIEQGRDPQVSAPSFSRSTPENQKSKAQIHHLERSRTDRALRVSGQHSLSGAHPSQPLKYLTTSFPTQTVTAADIRVGGGDGVI
jgi:hypothetical protein